MRLSHQLQSILVPTPDDAIRAAAWLKNNISGGPRFWSPVCTAAAMNIASDFTTSPPVPRRDANTAGGIDVPRGRHSECAADCCTCLSVRCPKNMRAWWRRSKMLTGLSLATGDMFVTTDGIGSQAGNWSTAGNGRALKKRAAHLLSANWRL